MNEGSGLRVNVVDKNVENATVDAIVNIEESEVAVMDEVALTLSAKVKLQPQ